MRVDHNLDDGWHLNRREKAILTLFFLRGARPRGELRGRSDRLQSFDSVSEVEDVLRDMNAHSEPLVRELPRRPGQKEERWAHTTGGAIVETAPEASETHELRSEPLTVRVQRLEEQVATLTAALNELKTRLGE